MKPTVKAETLDAAKKTIGAVLLLAAVVIELWWPQQGKAITACTMVGSLLLGLGLQSARGKALEGLLQQVFGTTKPSDVVPLQVALAARSASVPPSPDSPRDR